MTVKVAINGFGRIGRSVFRIITQRLEAGIEVVAINDLSNDDELAYLLRFDTVMGPFPGEVSVEGGFMTADGQRPRMLAEPDPARLPWKELGVQIVVEATGVFRTHEMLQKHLEAGADRVVLTVPPKDHVDEMVVLGVNDEELDDTDVIVSNASCTTNCLAPLAKILDDTFGIERGLMTTVHAYTNDQRLADVPHKDPRRSRAATENIIPTTTGAAKAVGVVLPELEGKLDGVAMRVPVPDGSIVDFVVQLESEVSVDAVNEAVRSAAEGEMAGVVLYSDDLLVSSDVIGDPHSCIFDAPSTQVDGDLVRVVAWYDNEWGYSNRVVDLIERLAAFEKS